MPNFGFALHTPLTQHKYEFVAAGERIEGKVMRQLRNALQPFINDVHVSWGALPVVYTQKVLSFA